MVLDAETLLLAPRAAELIAASKGSELPGHAQGELFASALELNTEVCASPAEAERGAARAARRGEPSGRGAGPASRGGRKPSAQPARGRGDRRRAALRGVRRLRGRVGPAAGRQRAARPRRHAERRGVLPRARGRPALAAGRARALGELALSPAARRRACSRTAPRCSHSFPGAGRLPPSRSYEDWEAFVDASCASASAPTTRGSGGTSGRIRSSGRSRSGCPTSRPRSRSQSAITAIVRDLCARSARAAAPRARPGGARHLPAEPLGGGALRPERGARPSGRRKHRAGVGAGRRACGRPVSTRRGPRPIASSRWGAQTASKPSARTSSSAR